MSVNAVDPQRNAVSSRHVTVRIQNARTKRIRGVLGIVEQQPVTKADFEHLLYRGAAGFGAVDGNQNGHRSVPKNCEEILYLNLAR